VDDFVRKLAAALQHHNRALLPERRLRLRLAIHHGSAAPASNGFFGQGVVVVNRLVDSPVLRAALAASDADLAVILSRQVYTDTVVQGYTSFDPADFRKIRVRNKEFSEDAWIWVSRGDVHALDLSDNPARRHLPAPLPRRRSNGARNVIIAALLAALVTSGVVASARLWNRGAPLRFEVVGSCTSAGGTLGNRSSGFTPGGHYRTTAAYPDGRPYTNFLLGAVGTASRDESVSWSWDCQGDPPGTYWTQLTDEATGRSTGRVPFTIGSPPQP